MSEAKPDPVDIHVGAVLRARRHELGQSQSELAEALGVSFQQVQKYERGANRISASVLFRAAQAQQVAPSHYFEGLTGIETRDVSPEAAEIRAWLQSAQAWSLAQAVVRLSAKARSALLDVARAMDAPDR